MLLIQGVPEERTVIIPHPIDLKMFTLKPLNDSLRAKLGCKREDPLILFIGRLHKSKGLNFLLGALKRLHLDGSIKPFPKLVVIGTGERERAYKELALKLGIAQHVVWCGGVSYHDLPDYYAAADIFVLPSIPLDEWQEQFGMVLIEAMACGKPVIATLSGSIPDVVGDAGILVQSADFQSLYQAMKDLLLTPGLRSQYSEKARKRAEREFSTDRVAEETARIYRKLVTDKGAQTGA
jgi:alpha-maltose-1-phosphate synthase